MLKQRRLQEFAPRRTSGRVQKLKEKKEEEEKRLASEEVIVPSNFHQDDNPLSPPMSPATPCNPSTVHERSFEEELLADIQENNYVPEKKRRGKKRNEPLYKEEPHW